MSRNQCPRIGILCWEEGCNPRGLEQLEELKGNSVNPETFDFPVQISRVKGANIHTILENPSRKTLAEMIKVAREMEANGIKYITTSCGFNAIFQGELANSVNIPVFTSSLLQIPMIQQIIGSSKYILVITANKSALTEAHFRGSGVTDTSRILVDGLESNTEWNKIFVSPDEDIEIDLLKEDLIKRALQIQQNYTLGAIVLECTDLPPFADSIRKATGLPVFDFVTMTEYIDNAFSGID